MSDETHALLSASDSSRWSKCVAALRHTRDIADSSSKYADEGSAAHFLCAWALENNTEAKDYPHKTIPFNGADWPVTDEMVASVTAYVNYVRKAAEGGTLLVEQRVSYAAQIGVDQGLAFGTSDAVILKDDTIHVVDFKYGMGEKVDAVDADGAANPQLMLYALGAFGEYDYLGDFTKVRMTIYQPRIDHVSEHEVDVTSLKTFALQMKAAALKALAVLNSSIEPLPSDFSPGAKACRWCRGKATCPALRANIEEETRDLFASFVPHSITVEEQAMTDPLPPAAFDEDVIGKLMSKVGLLEDFCKAVRAEAERRLLAGQPVTGFKLVEGRRGARKWKDEKLAERTLRRILGVKNAMTEPEVISPTQVDDRFVKKGKLTEKEWKNICKNTEQSDGKPSVAPQSDPRKALVVSSVEDTFAALVDQSAGMEDLV